MAKDDKITAVAFKSDVDNSELPATKLNYFKSKKEHTVGDENYYVSTRYNRGDGIAQLQKMLELCEGNSNAFQIIGAPEKKPKSKGDKKGLGEFLK